MSFESTNADILAALRELCPPPTHTWVGSSLAKELTKHVDVSEAVASRHLRVLTSLGVISDRKGVAKRRKSFLTALSYQWTLLKPDARLVKRGSHYELAE